MVLHPGTTIGSRLDGHVDAGAHRRHDLGVGAAVRCPGIVAATDQLPGSVVDLEQHRRPFPLLAAEADMELPANAVPRPVSDRRERLPVARSWRSFRLRDGEAVVPFLRSEEHTSELQSLMRNSYAVFC